MKGETQVSDVWKTTLDVDIDEYVVKSETPVDYKTDKGKPRLALVPPIAIEAIGTIMTYGLDKYKEGSWRTVEPYRYKDALMRHLVEYLKDPYSIDQESGYLHSWHIACNIAFLLEMEGECKK